LSLNWRPFVVSPCALDSAPGAGHFVQEEQPEAEVAAVRELWVTAALAGPLTTAG
jgi:pimeloyl-ACP methyl ester carboxylesterase